ncbi:ectoine/hydroxyectoine ABC transporter permease subunit EhuC [Tomitella fengzijianii]|uniref:Ectoine/hydroxyectoine ABC transporter permease subunit EhuC n=1 Tax=Tomitella fengzijianii TaxID=2597660 RepID=A0A516X1D5_9ACTN|nr:ectoine/hydroxyectoine ABC transporter permease subunit EhuC [Tomitella fengzijianii]QDQ96878.1 ectoine/hydroxyectoine ABC transporter permease subunit EhuC [Tomitella fengzijianii]
MGDQLDAVLDHLPDFQHGLVVTLELTAGGTVLMFILAFTLGLASTSPAVVVRGAARVVIEFFRGTSLVVQMFWLFYVLPQLGVEISPMLCGILALGLNYGAYGAEVVRGSLGAVPVPQREAAVALGFSPVDRFRRVVFPQAWVQMIPPMKVLIIQLLKGSAIASAITLVDLNFQGEILRNATGNTFLAYGIVLVLYFIIAYVIEWLMKGVEYLAKHRLGLVDTAWWDPRRRMTATPAPAGAAPSAPGGSNEGPGGLRGGDR